MSEPDNHFRTFNAHDWYWIVGDESGVYSSAVGATVADDAPAYLAFRDGGGVPTRIASHDELVAVLRKANVPPYHRVGTYTVVVRLQAAGLFDQAMAALENDPAAKWRFTTADSRGGIDADAPDNRAFLTAIGADPDVILAPDK